MDNVKFERWWKLQGLDSQNNSELFKSVARHAWEQSTKHPSDYFGFGQEDEHEEGKRRRQERLNASAEQSDREYYR